MQARSIGWLEVAPRACQPVIGVLSGSAPSSSASGLSETLTTVHTRDAMMVSAQAGEKEQASEDAFRTASDSASPDLAGTNPWSPSTRCTGDRSSTITCDWRLVRCTGRQTLSSAQPMLQAELMVRVAGVSALAEYGSRSYPDPRALLFLRKTTMPTAAMPAATGIRIQRILSAEESVTAIESW